MENTIILKDFLSSKRILHSDTASNYTDGLRFFIENENNSDITTYNYTKDFLLLNVDVLGKDKEGKYFYEYSVERFGDIVDNISSPDVNVQLTYYIGGIKYMPEEVNQFVIVSSMYHEFKIRITFMEKPTSDNEFKILLRYYLINTSDRQKLTMSKVITENIIYSNGMAIKR
jgi:hypothetical protein